MPPLAIPSTQQEWRPPPILFSPRRTITFGGPVARPCAVGRQTHTGEWETWVRVRLCNAGDAVGIRQKLNDNPALAGAVAVVVIVGALVVLWRTGCSTRGDTRAGATARQFFSVDDGKTWFADDASKVPPFDYQGKPAYRVRVYRCPSGKEFVSHLERYADADRKRLQDSIDAYRSKGGPLPPDDAFFNAMEVKKPGDKDWLRNSKATQARYELVMRPRCPDGQVTGIEMVMPK
jgi:hypothetical protein